MTTSSVAGLARMRRGLRMLDGGREAYYARVAAYYESRYGLYGRRVALVAPSRRRRAKT